MLNGNLRIVNKTQTRILYFWALLAGLLMASDTPCSAAAGKKESSGSKPTAAKTDNGASSFGFTGPETYPIDPFISQLRAADLDGDGLNDLVIVNNSRSKITLLYNQTGKTNIEEPHFGVKPDLNELPPDARFRIDSIASEK